MWLFSLECVIVRGREGSPRGGDLQSGLLNLVSTQISIQLGQTPTVFLASLPLVVERMQSSLQFCWRLLPVVTVSLKVSSTCKPSPILARLIHVISPALTRCSFFGTIHFACGQGGSLHRGHRGSCVIFQPRSPGLRLALGTGSVLLLVGLVAVLSLWSGVICCLYFKDSHADSRGSQALSLVTPASALKVCHFSSVFLRLEVSLLLARY